ncbi:MAG: BrnA antitoxin family protein [Acidobacteria bacterium]|nr:BrnA antitoxin family protein [Acidobacteriota bacterium]
MKNKDIEIEVTKEQYEAQLASGLTEDEIIPPGKHTFRRGGFREMFPNYDPKTSKARINIYIDLDVLQHFRKRAEKPNAAPYQTQINAELRKIMERDLTQEKAEIDETAKRLLNDDGFIDLLSKRLREKEAVLS